MRTRRWCTAGIEGSGFGVVVCDQNVDFLRRASPRSTLWALDDQNVDRVARSARGSTFWVRNVEIGDGFPAESTLCTA
jgi:hypothetical protein